MNHGHSDLQSVSRAKSLRELTSYLEKAVATPRNGVLFDVVCQYLGHLGVIIFEHRLRIEHSVSFGLRLTGDI